MVEITAFRLECKSCKGFFLKNKFSTNEITRIYNRSYDLYVPCLYLQVPTENHLKRLNRKEHLLTRICNFSGDMPNQFEWYDRRKCSFFTGNIIWTRLGQSCKKWWIIRSWAISTCSNYLQKKRSHVLPSNFFYQ